MNGKSDSNKNKTVDNNGIRLAPPIAGDSGVMPSVRQEFVLEPRLDVAESRKKKDITPYSQKDFQPLEIDKRRPWKRKMRLKNFVAGFLMFIIGAITILPYILGIFNKSLDFLPFAYTAQKFNVIAKLVQAVQTTIAFGGVGADVNAAWIACVPSLILTVGIIALIVNLIKSFVGMCGVIKPKRYYLGAIVYLFSVLAIFIASLIGASTIGIEKIDFMADFVYGWQSSEITTMVFLAVVNLLFSVLASIISPKKAGY